jgi:hypothetical protein
MRRRVNPLDTAAGESLNFQAWSRYSVRAAGGTLRFVCTCVCVFVCPESVTIHTYVCMYVYYDVYYSSAGIPFELLEEP